MTFLKWRLLPLCETVHQLPAGDVIELSHVGLDGSDDLCVWIAAADMNAPTVTRVFNVIGTGHELPNGGKGWRYLGSATQGGYVWHVFVQKTDAEALRAIVEAIR